jgi:hypothetical protein
MNPLLTQKIKWGVRLKNDGIVGERKQPIPGKGGRWWWSEKRESDVLAHPLSHGRHMLRFSHALVVTQILGYCGALTTNTLTPFPIVSCTLFSSTHPSAIGKYYHYPHS